MNTLPDEEKAQQGASLSSRTFMSRLGGVAGLVGVLLGLVEGFGLVDTVPGMEMWLLILPNLVVLFWFIGVFSFQSPGIGNLGALGLGAALVGLLSVILLNFLQRTAQTGDSSIANNLLSSPAMPWILTSVFVLFVWGILALGTASLRSGLLPRGAVIMWMVGMMASLNTQWLPVLLVGVTGVIWTSIVLLFADPKKDRRGLPDEKPDLQKPQAASGGGRLLPLDALRGVIMALMAIDHASYFVRRWHPFETWDQPLPDYPSLAAMLTRLATHPCAPGFFLLMGAGVILFAHSRRQLGWSERKIAGHLAMRGLLLIVLEQLIVDVAAAGKVYPLEFSILSGLGVAMIFGILFLRVSGVAQVVAGIFIIMFMQYLPGLLLQADLGIFNAIRLLLLPGSVGNVFVLYAPVPWLGVTLLGMAFANLLLRDQGRAYRTAGILGLVCLAFFPLVRLLAGFGNLRMPVGDSLIDFFNLVKYPPSLSFLLLSLGFDLVLLYLFSRISTRLVSWIKPVVILGRSALYFFLAHWFVYAALGIIQGGLPKTYLMWIIGLILLYPVCKTFEAFKHRMPVTSVWRML